MAVPGHPFARSGSSIHPRSPPIFPKLTSSATVLLSLAAAAVAAPFPGGPPPCPNQLTDAANCHRADFTLASPSSSAAPNTYRVAENFRPAQANPQRLCWVGRYQNRVVPAVPDESFLIRIFGDGGGVPDLASGPIFERTFRQSGSPGVDQLELSCYFPGTCPGSSSPPGGGQYTYSVVVGAGLPLEAGGCYWLEISNIGSYDAGVPWGWVSSPSGIDGAHLFAPEGVYTPYSYRQGDLSLCVSGGLLISPPGCRLTPPPPVCTNNGLNGHLYNGITPTLLRASSPGSTGRAEGPGAWTPTQYADMVHLNYSGPISGICFWGSWSGVTDSGGSVPVAPPDDPAFDIVYYASTGDAPGAPLPAAVFRTGTTPGVTLTWDHDRVSSVTHPPVNFLAGACHWISISRVQHQQAPGEPVAPLWHWQMTSSPFADASIRQRDVSVGLGPWTDPGCIFTCSGTNLSFLLDRGPARLPDCPTIPPADCNGNGTPDVQEIAANPASDCFNPAAAANPNITGGPDGVPDSCQCTGDWNRDTAVNSGDISAFLTSWLASVTQPSTGADIDCSGTTNSGDISAFLTRWLAAVSNADPLDGCP